MSTGIPVVNAAVNNQKEKLESVRLAEPGFHPARCYSVVDLGHQHSSKYNKWSPKLEYVFELLDVRQRFYEDDTEERPTVVSVMQTNSMGKQSNLRKFASNAFGKTLSDEEAAKFNVYGFADKLFMVQITHSEPNNEGRVYENISAVAPLNPAMVGPNVNMNPHNEILCFHIPTHGFNSPNYALLPGFKKGLILKSQEAMEYAKNGGKFAEREEFQTENSAAQGPAGSRPQPAQSNAPQQNASSQKPALVMLVTDYTYEQYIASGWTDESLIKAGHAKLAAPAPSAPSGPPQGPGAPVAPQGNMAPPQQPQGMGGDLPANDLGGLQY